MERASLDHFTHTALKYEHSHRYELATRVARGWVLDCACGIGYGSQILIEQPLVNKYLGIDPSEEAISVARNNYSGAGVAFEVGTLEELPCNEGEIDTFVMLETLEHTVAPDLAIANIKKKIKADGLLIGSVPSAEYETVCEQTYGPNPYHIQRFSIEELKRLLEKNFEAVEILSTEFVFGTLVQPTQKDPDLFAHQINASPECNEVMGSLLFLAGATGRVNEAFEQLKELPQFFVGAPKVIIDQEEVIPLRKAFQNAEEMIEKRDEAIRAIEKMVDERDQRIRELENLISKRGKFHALFKRWG
jgi:2-polyprenyl-3-methyl-5-hydroxy-6-metoxy-1,4-benzoquinol methylase